MPPVEINGTTGVSLVQDDTITDAKLALDANASEIKDALNATGSAPIYACRAWVNFNGTTNTGGNCDIRASGNVSTVSDNGAGDYTINFTNAMPDDDYAICVQQTQDTSTSNTIGQTVVSTSTTSYRIRTLSSAFNPGDAADVTSFVVR